MRIAIISDYSPNEPKAASIRLTFVLQAIKASGDEIVLLCPRDQSFVDNRITYVPIGFPVKRSNMLKRLLDEFRKMIMIFRQLRVLPVDVVFISSPPFSFTTITLIMARLKKVPLLLDIRDVYPLALVEGRVMSNTSLIYKALKGIERRLYGYSSVISVVTKEMLVSLKTEYPRIQKKLVFFPNGSTRVCSPKNVNQYSQEPVQLVQHGTLGRFQDAMLLVEMAKYFKTNNKSAQIVLFASEGKEKEKIKDLVTKFSLDDFLKVNDLIPSEIVIDTLTRFTFGLSLRKEDALSMMAYPVKIFDYFSSGIPVIMTPVTPFNSEVEKRLAGKSFRNDEVESLCEYILQVAHNPETYSSMSNAAVNMAKDYYRPKLSGDYWQKTRKVLLASIS